MQDLVTKNIWVKLISIAIALLLWSYVVGERNVQIGLNVPLELRNVPGGYIVTNKIERQVEMRVAGAKNLLNVLNASETSAFLDLTNAREGKNIFHINERNFKIPKDIKITSIYPESIEVILEKYIKKSVPVIPDIKDFSSIQDKIARLVVEPSSVTIEGPEVDLKNIARVKTEIVQPTRFKGEENISVPIKLEGRFVRSVGGGMVTVRIKFR
jgi:YbbR domain-containing protein